MSAEDLLAKWNDATIPIEDISQRDELLVKMREMGLYPRIMSAMDAWEDEAGLYPDTEDPRFTEKLMRKQEFAENKQDSIAEQEKQKVNPCDPDKEFELTPVQRFIGRFLSPQCPYQSALLYHGVGVGKTCAAITVAENYLRSYPRRQVIIVAPRNIQPGFRRTIFDDEALIVAEDSAPNTAKGCTGNTYLKRTGTEFEHDRAGVTRRITQSINSRYIFMGYIQFHRMIDDLVKKVPKGLDDDAAAEQRDRILRREFSGRLVIIDEAHNLRDNPAESAEDDTDAAGGETELTESQAGKKLTPSLMKVLTAAEGMKLVLMSGTPMYNSYREIIFLLNLLLMNDKKATLSERDIFTSDGNFKKSGEELLGGAANAYVSFMRGENPLSFPVRLPPQGTPPLPAWPENNPKAEPIPPEQRERMKRLPFVPVSFEGDSMVEYKRISAEAVEAAGLGVGSIDEMVQSGNWLFPSGEGVQIRDAGFDSCFEDTGSGGTSQFKARAAATWLQAENLGAASPKAKLTIERAATAKGIVFVYSRFIKSGALPLALALEANGYSPLGDRRPLLIDGPQGGQGRQCAMCPRKEKAHAGAGHKFVPARYILITGRANISPNNATAIQAARAKTNMDGRDVKIVIGSQVASEGIDFRFVREIYVFDSWFHLNKMEQVLGRGIRTCSHSLLPVEDRNCTIHLLVNILEGEDTETADLYMYRNAMSKAMQVGKVTRVLKRYALDCNLNRDAIIVAGLATQRHVDAQGVVRDEVNINDTPFTNVCDWIETCEYDCAKRVDIDMDNLDTTTYDEFAVRWRESELKTVIRKLFQERQQPVFQLEEILEMMSAVPARAISGLLSEIVGNQSFRLRVGKIDGYIVYRNGYYMFQPDYLADVRIPLALRVAEVPVKRDSYEPAVIKVAPPEAEAAAPAPPAEGEAPREGTLAAYWKAIKGWAIAIGTPAEPSTGDIPVAVQKAIAERYVGDAQYRENDQLIMVNWLHDHIQSSSVYTGEQKASFLHALGEALLGMVWDESIKPNEQLEFLAAKDPIALACGAEQIAKKGERQALRAVDVTTGTLKYTCEGAPCAEAVARIFETNPDDPLNSLKADNTTAAGIYGFIVPKGKEGRLVFKTNERPVAPGTKPEKGGECSIVSTIAFHIRMLKDIAGLMEAEGYPKFILTEQYLDVKAQKKTAKAAGAAAGAAEPVRTGVYSLMKGGKPFKTRSFENAVRACALKDIILRWTDIMQRRKAPTAKRFFYRPVAALKSGHKGSK
jgi:superfamily II DNA or RNA helicase